MGSESLNTVEKVVLVRLYGKLGTLFGREHRLSVSSVREAIRALCIMIPGFELWLETSQERGITYAIFNGERNIREQDLQLDGVHEVIRIAPVIIGSKKNGAFQTIFGAVLVAVGFVLSFTPYAAASPFLYKMGAAMMLGGVAQMLVPAGTQGMTNESKDTRKSYSFGAPANQVAAGSGVPILYGIREIGGVLISGGIYAEDQN
ncbi:MAG: tail assembly protein [Citrobacter freundii]|nr:tail assembly protein [Citrobacter freundii]HAT2340096.1 tail assembly protein [Citrobacter freundii]HAT2362585.1 tail assembly protein [Citrobacter freundii]HCD1220487.1 tail assembly protein [Citrobacter freundii]HCD1225823.1 tail assembly protein [Citrobacter freundii]